jgi:hypothetical protein
MNGRSCLSVGLLTRLSSENTKLIYIKFGVQDAYKNCWKNLIFIASSTVVNGTVKLLVPSGSGQSPNEETVLRASLTNMSVYYVSGRACAFSSFSLTQTVFLRK